MTNPTNIATQPAAYSIDEWCRRYGICRATFYNMQKAGRAPKTIKLNKLVRISVEADQEWRKASEVAA
ncbi:MULTISPECIES: hypothetical protein [Hyphomicrobiales]|jgi:predicted DNA-binding transcriptional regulator AlpA|uniref:helix-turn-helix transcriptional regulator n=1 Tax=Methylobacterium sp. CCH7-A2 TaxID=1768789 RepID=UPI00082B44E4|nr:MULTISPECIES: hypothetical protein [Hyphomicrobiales]